jgi:ABC-type transporter Mla maintaining outer membrane lipid asymmetry ATPase subunit MlaF
MALLHEGRIVAQGTAEQLAASDDPLVRRFLQSEGGG